MVKNILKILIVEDDMIYAIRLKHWINKLDIKNVDIVESAESGGEYLEKTTPHIIFLDKELPGSKGTEAIQNYKKRAPETTIILMSASYNVEDVALGIQEGADFLFDKNTTDKAGIDKIIDAVILAKNKNKSIWKILSIFSSPKSPKDNLKIAIVEDDELFSFHMGWILEKRARKNKIETYSDARSFFLSYNLETPDIVFLDYSLPDTNGEAILAFIKEKNPKTSVVMISSQDSPQIALKLKSMGIENYIVKDKNWTANLKSVIESLGI